MIDDARANCYPAAVKRESLSSARGGYRRGAAASREVNLAKAVIKLISYLEDARMYRADRENDRSASRSLVFSLTILIIRDSPLPFPLSLFLSSPP